MSPHRLCAICGNRAVYHDTQVMDGSASERHLCADHRPSELQQLQSQVVGKMSRDPAQWTAVIDAVSRESGLSVERVRSALSQLLRRFDPNS